MKRAKVIFIRTILLMTVMVAFQGCSLSVFKVSLDVPSKTYIPQGLKKNNNGSYYMSFHDSDKASYVYKVDLDTGKLNFQFKMPEDATHTSGICFDGNRLIAVDYNSDKIYLIDFDKSIKSGFAEVTGYLSSGLQGTSACEIVKDKQGEYLLISDFRNTGKTYIYNYKNILETSSSISDYLVASYENDGFSQGLLYNDGFIYESSNSLLALCKISKRSFSDIINMREYQVSSKYIFSIGIQDMTIKDNSIFFTDEVTFFVGETDLF